VPSHVLSSTHYEISLHLGNKLTDDYNTSFVHARYPVYFTYLVRGGVDNGSRLPVRLDSSAVASPSPRTLPEITISKAEANRDEISQMYSGFRVHC